MFLVHACRLCSFSHISPLSWFSSCRSLLSRPSRPSETQTSLSASGVPKAILNPPANRSRSHRSGLSRQQAVGGTEEHPVAARLATRDQPHASYFSFRAVTVRSEAAANHRPLLGPPAAARHLHSRSGAASGSFTGAVQSIKADYEQ